jgi:hypothetical protein
MKPVTAVKDRLLSVDELDRGIVRLASKINAATYELLVLVRQFDERAGWLNWGFDNCADWLHWRVVVFESPGSDACCKYGQRRNLVDICLTDYGLPGGGTLS